MYEHFKDPIIVGECYICKDDIQLKEEVYYDGANDCLICNKENCFDTYRNHYLFIEFGEVDEEGMI